MCYSLSQQGSLDQAWLERTEEKERERESKRAREQESKRAREREREREKERKREREKERKRREREKERGHTCFTMSAPAARTTSIGRDGSTSYTSLSKKTISSSRAPTSFISCHTKSRGDVFG